MTDQKLWLASSTTPHGNDGDTHILVVASTRDEAIAKAEGRIDQERGGYVPRQERIDSINLEGIEPIEDGAILLCPK